jgi:thiol-disulfide isomerase/thioredoxin
MKSLLVLSLLFTGLPQLQAAAVGCESSPAVEAALRDLDRQAGDLPFTQRNTFEDQAYQAILRLDSLDPRPILRYQSHVANDEAELYDALRDKTVADAHAHPDDPAKQVAAAFALEGKDTPQAFRMMEQLAAQHPDYAPAIVRLARMYSQLGKFIDKDKAVGYLGKYYNLCPAGLDPTAMRILKKLGSPEQKALLAGNLRQRLATTTDPDRLRTYSDIWSLEFATLPVTEHPKERRRVQQDLTRLEALKVPPSAAWLDFLKDGYKQSGAPEAQVKAIETRISKEFPQSDEAFTLWYESWKDKHPQPAGEASAADWQQYMWLALDHYREVATLFPNEHGFGYFLLEYTAHLNGEGTSEITREGEAFLKDSDLYDGPSAWTRQQVAGNLLDHNIDPAHALALLKEARVLLDSPHAKASNRTQDYSTPKELQEAAQNRLLQQAFFQVAYLRACLAAGDKASAEALKAAVDSAVPADPKVLVPYWTARAVLAEIEGRNTDALAFYQKALFLREPPEKQYGVMNDRLLAGAHRVWAAAQGSEEAFAIWSKPDTSSKPVLAEGRWETPDKELPAFELADLQGKTWKLTSLEGKKILINIWATWCGPCQSELPHFQKLYEQTKDRTDIVLITLNFDEDVGMVDPFVKKKGFTFPVLPAYAFLAGKIDVNSIPRNWLIDANGKWKWEQIGFDSTEPDWEKSMLSRLEATK